MTEYKIGPAIVRIHGQCEPERLREATARFLKKVEAQRKRAAKPQKSNT